MSVEQVSKETRHFLDVTVEQDLFMFNTELWHKKKDLLFDLFIMYQRLEPAIIKIINSLDSENSDLLDENEKPIFAYWLSVHYLTSIIELCKIFFQVILNPTKISFGDNPTYGTIIKRICDALKYNDSLKNTIFDILYVSFRNAIDHEDYKISKDGLVINIRGMPIYYTQDMLTNAMNEVKAIYFTIEKFANEKAQGLDIKADELEKQYKELQRKIKELEKSD